MSHPKTRSLHEVTEARLKRKRTSRKSKGVLKTLAALRKTMTQGAGEAWADLKAAVAPVTAFAGFSEVPAALRSTPHANAPRGDAPEKTPLEVGRTVITRHGLKIHRYYGILEVTETANAGKRGKSVRQVKLYGSSHQSRVEALLGEASHAILSITFDEARDRLVGVAEASGGLLKIEDYTLRGVDVEPAGTPVDLHHEFPDGRIVKIHATPNEFRVRDSYLLTPRVGPKKDHELRQDTLHWQAKKKDAQIFYRWIQDGHLKELAGMTFSEIRQVWVQLGVKWDSH